MIDQSDRDALVLLCETWEAASKARVNYRVRRAYARAAADLRFHLSRTNSPLPWVREDRRPRCTCPPEMLLHRADCPEFLPDGKKKP